MPSFEHVHIGVDYGRLPVVPRDLENEDLAAVESLRALLDDSRDPNVGEQNNG